MRISDWSSDVCSSDLEIIARAFHTAVSGRPGPVVVSLPEDMLTEPCHAPDCPASPVQACALSVQTQEQITAALGQAQRPLVVVGGSNWSESSRAALSKIGRAHV